MSNSAELFARAWQHHQANQFPEAEELYRQVVHQDPQHTDAWCFLGALCSSQGRLEEAEGYLRQALTQAPHFATALNCLGAVLGQLGKLEDAATMFQRLISYQPEDTDAWNNLGLVRLRQGRLDDAIASFERSLDLKADLAPARTNLVQALQQKAAAARPTVLPRPGDAERVRTLIEQGHVFVAQGRLHEAAANYQQVLEMQPYRFDIVNELGNVGNLLGDRGDPKAACACYEQMLRFKPDYPEVHNNLGKVLADQGHLEDGVANYRRALRLKPDYPEAHNNLGAALADLGRLSEATSHYQQALRLRPEYAEAHNNLGTALAEQGRQPEAVASYRQAIRLRPDYPDAHYNLGNALASQGQFDAAVASGQRAIALQPERADAHIGLGNAFAGQGRLQDAEASYRQAIRLNPAYVEAHHNLGLALTQSERLDEALASYDEAIRLNPGHAEAHFNRAATLLLRGDFERGWPEYEWRWKRTGNTPRSFSVPIWDGAPLAGRTILLHAEQGLGDTIQFLRYAPLVKQRGGRVLVECQPPLLRLASTCPDIDQLLPQGAPLPKFDVHSPLLSLPGILGTTVATIPNKVPYLHADPQLVEQWSRKLGTSSELKVGIAWQGSPTFAQDKQRSIPLREFAPLGKLPGIRLICLQKGLGREQLPQIGDQFSVVDLGDQFDQGSAAFLDTAAIMQNLDLVIAPSSAIAHLAGALAVRVWVALPAVPDWRWLLDRADSPWYPTARLFRQPRTGDWAGAFEAMAQAIRELVPKPVN